MSYKVGQILYVVPTKQTAVYPMQVIEEITRKTLDGTETDYLLKAGLSDQKTISHKEIQGEIFDTVEKAKITLTERATRSIARLVDSAHKKAREWYPTAFPDKQNFQQVEDAEQDDSQALITLEDGTVARLKIPNILKQ